jgi:hypothetical protein
VDTEKENEMRYHSVITWAGCVVAGLVILFVLTNTTSGNGDENEKLRKEVKAAIESQLMGNVQPVERFYKTAGSFDRLTCVPSDMKVPDILRDRPHELLKEPHRTRYKVHWALGDYRATCFALRISYRFAEYQVLAASEGKALASLRGLARLTAVPVKIHEKKGPPEGYVVYAKAFSVMRVLSGLPGDCHAYAAALITDTEPRALREFESDMKHDWDRDAEKGKAIAVATIKKAQEELNKQVRKGQLTWAFEKCKASETAADIYSRLKAAGIERDVFTHHLSDSGLVIEEWHDRELKACRANAVADVRCLVELNRDAETKKWKVEKMWLLSELDVPKKAK